MLTPDDAGIDDPGPTDAPARRTRWGRRSLTFLAALLLLTLVLAVAFAAVMHQRVQDQDGRDAAAARAQATAEQFVLRMDNFDGSKLDAYVAGITQLLTTKAKTEFGKEFTSFKQVYEQGHAKGVGKVLLTGVGDADQDSATVLVAHDATVTSDFGTQERHHRWSISLARIDGKWLVDDFTPVN